MDKTPDSSSARRSQKRPHSPQDERTAPVDAKVPATDTGNILECDAKRDKLMRLLGGKKRKNETAASKWLERVRSREDELKVSTDLESHFNESLSNKLSGASRRHLGIGFHDDKPPQQPSSGTENVDTSSNSGVTISSSIQTPPVDAPTFRTAQDSSVVDSLSNRANVPGISSRVGHIGSPTNHGYPRPPYGYGMGPNIHPSSMVPPHMYGYPGPFVGGGGRPPGYMMPPPNYGPPLGPPNFTRPPDPSTGHWYPGPIPPPPRPEKLPEKSDPGPKSKSSFYAQFKKAS